MSLKWRLYEFMRRAPYPRGGGSGTEEDESKAMANRLGKFLRKGRM